MLRPYGAPRSVAVRWALTMTFDAGRRTRRSIRLRAYDYSGPGAYFVTICAHDHRCIFGEITDGEMRLSEMGAIAQRCWEDMPHHFSGVELDVFLVMPNHLHGMVVILRDDWHTPPQDHGRGAACCARTERPAAWPFGGPSSGSLAAIVRSFKSAVTRRVNSARGTPGHVLWQRNYYEHVVRNQDDLNEVRRYILDNPPKWEMDHDNPERRR